MDEKIKSYRQAMFKLDHAERKRGDVPARNRQSESLPFSPAALAVSRIMLSASSGCISCLADGLKSVRARSAWVCLAL